MRFTWHYSGSSGNLYTLSSGDHVLLIEAGVRMKAIRSAVWVPGLDGCLVTHAHGDHAKGVHDLMAKAVDCYMTKETADMLDLKGHRLHIVEDSGDPPPKPPYKPFTIADFWTVLAFPTEHDIPGSVAYLISDGKDKCLFLTDSFYFRYLLKGINILAIECNWSKQTLAPDLDPVVKKRLITSHFSLKNVLQFLDANDLSRCRQIHLIHLSNGNSDESMFTNAVRAATGIPTYVAG